MKSRILLLIMAILAPACVSVEVCEEEYVSELTARFKTMEDGTAADTTVNSLSIYGIREGENDSLLYNDASISVFQLPLDPGNNHTSFVLQIDTLVDTLEVYYEHEIYLISYTCGFASLFTLDQLETSSGVIQKDTIIKAMIDADYEANEEHIWLYL